MVLGNVSLHGLDGRPDGLGAPLAQSVDLQLFFFGGHFVHLPVQSTVVVFELTKLTAQFCSSSRRERVNPCHQHHAQVYLLTYLLHSSARVLDERG